MSKVWVTRDNLDDMSVNELSEEINIWQRKPKEPEKWKVWIDKDYENFYFLDDDAGHLVEMSVISFEKLYGYIPKKGSCTEKELILK